jgi:hypothetical protein
MHSIIHLTLYSSYIALHHGYPLPKPKPRPRSFRTTEVTTNLTKNNEVVIPEEQHAFKAYKEKIHIDAATSTSKSFQDAVTVTPLENNIKKPYKEQSCIDTYNNSLPVNPYVEIVNPYVVTKAVR